MENQWLLGDDQRREWEWETKGLYGIRGVGIVLACEHGSGP